MAKVQIDNATVLATVKPVQGYVDYFKGMNKVWHAAYGSKPTPEMLTAAVWLASKYRSPGIECLHIAMCFRPEGCTVLQYTNAGIALMNRTVGPANNKRKAIVASGLCGYTVEGKPYAYKLNFTDKGVKFIAAQVGAVDAGQVAPVGKPAKAVKAVTGKAKSKKATRVAPAQTPTSEALTVTVTAEANQATLPEPVELASQSQWPITVDQPQLGGVDPEHDQVTPADVQALAAHFNQG